MESNQALGSGIVFDAQGDIVTNDHVLAGSHKFQVVLADGKQYAARVVGTFPPDDLAVLHINASTLKPAAFADSTKLSVGDIARAIGNPLGRTVNESNGPGHARPVPGMSGRQAGASRVATETSHDSR